MLPTLWFRNTWSWGDETIQSRRCAKRDGSSSRRIASRTRRLHSALRRRSGVAVHRKRDRMQSSSLGTAERFALCQGCISRLCDRRAERGGESGQDRHQIRRHITCWKFRLAAARQCACGLSSDPYGRCLFTGLSMRPSQKRIDRGRRILRSHHSASLKRRRAPRTPAGAGRNAVDEAVLLFRSG